MGHTYPERRDKDKSCDIIGIGVVSLVAVGVFAYTSSDANFFVINEQQQGLLVNFNDKKSLFYGRDEKHTLGLTFKKEF